jgi:hypothetical protein
MRKIYTKLLWLFLLLPGVFLSKKSLAQSSGIYESYAILNINAGGNAYYDMQATTGNPDFQGANLGNFVIGTNTLVLNGSQNKTFKNGGCDITNGTLSYRIYKVGATPGVFSTLNLPFSCQHPTAGCGTNPGDQVWENTAGSLNVLTGLNSGSYRLEVFNSADYQNCGTGTHNSNNGGANYIANFNVIDPANPIEVVSTGGTTNAVYANLKLSFDAINAGTHTGAITINIWGNGTNPAAAAVLNSSGIASASYTSVLVRPMVDGVTVTATALGGRGVVELNGADNVTIDGDNPNTTGINRNLTFVHGAAATTTYTSVIRLATGTGTGLTNTDNVTIRNCILNGSAVGRNASANTSTTGSENTTFGIYCGGNAGATPTAIASVTTNSAASTTTINNFTADNNAINACARGIVFNGASAAVAPGITTITNNLIGDQAATLSGAPPYTSPTTTVYTKGIWVVGTTGLNITGNTLKAILSYVGTAMAAIELNTAIGTGPITINNNTITGVVLNAVTGSSARGISVLNSAGAYTISGNTITNIQNFCNSTTSTNRPTGLYVATAATSALIEKNKITTVYNRNTGTFGVTALWLNSGNNITLQNNFVADVNQDMTGGTAFSTTFGTNGIFVAAGTGHKIYHNTVNLFGSLLGTASASNLSAAFVISGTGQTGIDVRNNIFSNTMTGGTTSIAHVCMYLPTSGTAAMNLTMNNNAYYTGTTAGVHGICHGGTTYTNPVTVAGTGLYATANFNASATSPVINFRNYTSGLSAAGTNDNASFAFTAAAPFVSTTDLHISTGVTPTQLESAGATVGVTADIDNQVRPGPTGSVNGGAFAPDMGADEFDGVPLDLTPPSIVYTPLGFTCATGSRTLTATISDANGVPQAGAGLPVLYWRINAGAYAPVASTWVSGNTYTFTFGSGVVAGDVVSYYIVAQDNAPTPNVGVSPSTGAAGFSINPPAAATPPTTPSSYTIAGSLSGSYNVGTGQTYTTLTAAINAYNTNCLTGPVTFLLTDVAYTTSSDTIRVNPDANATNTLTIKPTLTGTTITGNTAAATIVLLGADYVTIDGSIGTTANTVCPPSRASRDLTISNTAATSGAVIWMATTSGSDAASNNKVINTNLIGNTTNNTLIGIGSGGTTIGSNTGALSNNNNQVINDSIAKVANGIYFNGATATKNTGSVIRMNALNTPAPNNVVVGGIFVGNDNGAIIEGNSVSGMVSSGDAFGISLGLTGWAATSTTSAEVINATVSKNIVGLVQSTGTNSAAGILVGTATSGTNTVSNNMIYGVISNSTPGDIASGILALGGTGSTTRIYYNTVSMTGDRGTGTTANSFALAIGGADPVVDVKNNILINKQTTVSTGRSYAIGTGSTTFANLISDYNDLFVSGANSTLGATVALNSSTNQATLAAWQTATTKDANSKNVDAVFVSATDLHLVSTSNITLNAGGTPVTGTTDDIDCEARDGSAPDIGADEFTPPVCTGAIAGTVSGNAAACGSYTGNITATGYSIGLGTTYQWVSGPSATGPWTAITGANNPASYTIAPPVTTSTYYRLAVACASNSSVDTSSVISIIISPLPTVSISPAGPVLVCDPATQVLTATTNAATPTYQWLRNGLPIVGANSATYTVSGISSGLYTVAVTDLSTTCSNAATPVAVGIYPLPTTPVIVPAGPVNICNDSTVKLKATATIANIDLYRETFDGGTVSLTVVNGAPHTAGTEWTLRSSPYTYPISPAVIFNSGAANFMLANSDAGNTGSQTNTSLISPTLSTTGLTKLSINMRHYYRFNSSSLDSARVQFSRDNGVTWVTLRQYTATTGTPTAFANETIVIDSLVNEPSLRFRLFYKATWDFYWAVDDIALLGTQAIAHVWSPTTELYLDPAATIAYTGVPRDSVYAKVTATRTYTVATASALSNCPAPATASVTINYNAINIGTTLAGTVSAGGLVQACNNAIVGTGRNYMDNGTCRIIATVTPSGASPVSGTINTCVSVDTGATKMGTARLYVARFFDVLPATAPATATGTVRLYFPQSEFDNYNLKALDSGYYPLPDNGANTIDSLRILIYHGAPSGGLFPGNYSGTVEELSIADAGVTVIWNPSGNGGTGWWEVTFPSNGFSGYFISSKPRPPLPIKVEYFRGAKQGGTHVLDWKVVPVNTANGVLTLERSSDGRSFSSVYSITASATRMLQPFSYSTTNLLKGLNYYRLRMVDDNGVVTYSSIVALLNSNTGFEMVNITPNPVTEGRFKLNVSAAEQLKMEVVVIDMTGRVVIRQTNVLISGFNAIEVNVGKLANGMYQVMGLIDGERTKALKFVKQ